MATAVDSPAKVPVGNLSLESIVDGKNARGIPQVSIRNQLSSILFAGAILHPAFKGSNAGRAPRGSTGCECLEKLLGVL